MSDWLAVSGVLYVLVGAGVCALTDTTAFASRMASLLGVVPFGVINRHVVLFAIFLWPLWLLVRPKSDGL